MNSQELIAQEMIHNSIPRKKRESNIELLRILATIAVIILHWNLDTIDNIKFVSEYYAFLALECLCICAVDLFIFISGYYSSNVSTINVWKAVRLLVEVIAIKILRGIINTIINGGSWFHIKWLIPNDYFVVFFVVLLFISPFLNKLVSSIVNKKLLFLLSAILFSVYPTIVDMGSELLVMRGQSEIRNLSSITRVGSLYGYTIINFMLLYMLGCLFRYFEKNDHFQKYQRFIILFPCLIMSVIVVFIQSILTINPTHFSLGTSFSYANPFVIGEAILLFAIFKRIKLSSKIINKVAKACFTVYLIHAIPLSLFESYAPFDRPLLYLLYVFGIILLSFLMAFAFRLVYVNTIEKFINYLERKKPLLIVVE